MPRIHNKLVQHARMAVYSALYNEPALWRYGRIYAMGMNVAINVDHIQGHPFSPRRQGELAPSSRRCPCTISRNAGRPTPIM